MINHQILITFCNIFQVVQQEQKHAISYISIIYTSFPYLIFVIYSPHMQFCFNFLSTQKRLNRDKTNLQQTCVNNKTNFRTKKHEYYTCGGIFHITHIQVMLRVDAGKIEVAGLAQLTNFKQVCE